MAKATDDDHRERRSSLHENEIDEIADRLWVNLSQKFENIGYDMTTAESRDQIRKDHQWVREWRTGATRLKAAAWTAGITGFVSGSLWLLWSVVKTAVRGVGS